MTHEARDGVKPLQDSAGATGRKTIIKAVVSHERLIAEIEARNPIIANRQTRKPVRRSSASDR
jgi:hypothetical protein